MRFLVEYVSFRVGKNEFLKTSAKTCFWSKLSEFFNISERHFFFLNSLPPLGSHRYHASTPNDLRHRRSWKHHKSLPILPRILPSPVPHQLDLAILLRRILRQYRRCCRMRANRSLHRLLLPLHHQSIGWTKTQFTHHPERLDRTFKKIWKNLNQWKFMEMSRKIRVYLVYPQKILDFQHLFNNQWWKKNKTRITWWNRYFFRWQKISQFVHIYHRIQVK